MKADPKHLLPLLLSVALSGHVAAEGTPDVSEKIRTVIPAGWEVDQQAGTPVVTGPSITTATVSTGIDVVRQAIETVLVPYESPAKRSDASWTTGDANKAPGPDAADHLTPIEPKQADLLSQAKAKPERDAATAMLRIRKAIETGPTFERLSDILGAPDMDIGSGIHIFVYRLSDGTGIAVGTPDRKKVMYIEHAGKRLFPVEPPAQPQPAAPTRPARALNIPGPADRDQSIAWSMAATFMAAQCFANTYAKAGDSVSPVAGHPGSYDVSFNALDPAKSDDVAIVRVDIKIPDKPVSIRLGERRTGPSLDSRRMPNTNAPNNEGRTRGK